MIGGVTTTVRGLDKLALALKRVALSLEERQAILVKCGQPLADLIALKAPRSKGKGPHAADTSKVRVVDGDSPDEAKVKIGPGKEPGNDPFYLFFLERGTARRPATPFIRPAQDEGVPSLRERIRHEVSAQVAQKAGSTGILKRAR